MNEWLLPCSWHRTTNTGYTTVLLSAAPHFGWLQAGCLRTQLPLWLCGVFFSTYVSFCAQLLVILFLHILFLILPCFPVYYIFGRMAWFSSCFGLIWTRLVVFTQINCSLHMHPASTSHSSEGFGARRMLDADLKLSFSWPSQSYKNSVWAGL